MHVSRPKSFKSRTINDLSNCCSQHSCSLNVMNARDVCNNNSSTLKPSPHLQHFSGNTVAQMYLVFPQLFSKYFHKILETVGNNWDTFSLVPVTKTLFSFPKPNGKHANILLPHRVACDQWFTQVGDKTCPFCSVKYQLCSCCDLYCWDLKMMTILWNQELNWRFISVEFCGI